MTPPDGEESRKSDLLWWDLDGLRYVYLTQIHEPRDNVLEIHIEQASASDFDEDIEGLGISVQSSVPDAEDSMPEAFTVQFTDYIAYSIKNEHYAKNETSEVFEGSLARVYSSSHFIEYVQASSLLQDASFTHYGLLCLEHVIDVIAKSAPLIQRHA